MTAYNVSLNGKHLDTVFFDADCSIDYVKRSLIDHDGFDAGISVRKVYGKQKFYIQRKGQGYLETVDEFDTRGEARAMLAEYSLSDPSAEYYVSTRPCNDWKD